MASRPEQAWPAMFGNTTPQSPETSAPHHHAHAIPFDQHMFPAPYSYNDNLPVPQFTEYMMPNFGNNMQGPSPPRLDQNFQTPFMCPPPPPSMQSLQAPPSRPSIPLRQQGYGSVQFNGDDFFGRNEQQQSSGYGEMRNSTSGYYPTQMGAYAAPSSPNNSLPRRPAFHTGNAHQQTPRYGGQGLPPIPDGASSERARLVLLHNRRHSQQEPHNRSFDHPEYRTPTMFSGHGRRPDRSISPRTSSTRRSYDRFSHDSAPAITSSDVEEATARLPPFSRARHRPRESRPRFHMLQQHVDPNIVSPKQIQDLKSRLPRRLPSELSDETGSQCDICQKDYSNAPVRASEEQEIAIELPCRHVFGEFCLFHWFDTCLKHKNKVTCPMCREVLIEPPRYHPSLAFARGSAAWQEVLRADLALGSA